MTAIMDLEGPFAMRRRVERRTVNLSAYSDLVVIYLGMRTARLWAEDFFFCCGTARRPATARDNHLLVISNACWHAPTLA
jgi:hypothetical protein